MFVGQGCQVKVALESLLWVTSILECIVFGWSPGQPGVEALVLSLILNAHEWQYFVPASSFLAELLRSHTGTRT